MEERCEVVVESPDPETTLLYFLRTQLRLTGTKLGCGEGGCGACTVMLSWYQEGVVTHAAVNACLAPLCSVDGMAVTTVEGIGSSRGLLHPVQERIARAHGSQCGFCTPGFVMSMYTLLRNSHAPSEKQIEGAFEGNLCRCTGYRPILEGFKTFSQTGCCGGATKCCMDVESSDGIKTIKGPSVLFDASKFRPLDPTQEPTFPPALRTEPLIPLAIKGPRVSWYRPLTLDQLLVLRARFPQSKLVIGNTEIGVEVKFKGAFYDTLISCSQVPELNKMAVTDEGLTVGASVTLTRLEEQLKHLVESLPENKTRTFSALLEMLRWFAGQQIRNVSGIGGNICNASPISDLNPTLLAAGVKLTIATKDSNRVIVMDPSFFTGYKKTAVKPGEILLSILIPFTKEYEFVLSYKQARRREDDIAIVNAGLRVVLAPPAGDSDWTVQDCCLSYGGMSYITTVAKKTQAYLIGKPWCESTLEGVCPLLLEDLPLSPDVPGGMPDYRRSLVTSFFYKFYLTVLSRLRSEPLPQDLVSATRLFERPPVQSSQGFQSVSDKQLPEDSVGRPLMHLSALQQASGEARYMDDIPPTEGELYAGLVLSTHPHANITVNWSEAVKLPGVKGYVGVADVPGSNATGPWLDEVVFADGKVNLIGQVIGLIVAESQPLAQRACKLVIVTYQDLPSVITIEDAIAVESYYPTVRRLESGNVDSALSDSDQCLEGVVRVGGQDHFYLETQGCRAVPKGENGEMEIVSSTQGVEATQKCAARALDVPYNRVVAKVKRIGGGFGGKETRSTYLSTAVAVAANKYQVPVRIMLDRNEDMITSGGRHPFLAKYKVGFTSAGRLTSLDLQLYSNAGYGQDLSIAVLERALTHSDNTYNIPNFRAVARACRTHIAPNTAFRGFGGPQGMIIMEQVVSHVASVLSMPSEAVRELNMYRDGDLTPWGQVQAQCPVRRCWDQLKPVFEERKSAAAEFNKTNRWVKRGVSLVPTKFGISFGIAFLNQGGALLHVYTDGSVLLTHGGMEMGQGLHTKMVQVCARCLGVPPEAVFVSETSTDTVPNSSPSAASMSTDLYGMAVKDCCDQIMARLKPVMDEDPEGGWAKWVQSAYHRRINLSVQGFYATPGLDFDWEKGRGNLYAYFSYGAAVAEVEVDTLTGDFTVLRTDIVMDVGDSINPAIDIGQVEGAFTQGLGLVTLEQCVYLEGNQRTQRGTTFTTGPGTYKIPSVSDVPVVFNVSLLDRAPNPKAIFSSKAVGEPPLFLAASVLFALREAVTAARAESGVSGYYRLDSPATCERIRMACQDKFVQQMCVIVDPAAKRWTVEA
ncbi:xanthine dehydrogenase/oxidase-like isoform X2 [Halichondria panicea]|uniref:xanthine dehydrogenase/oxidase-like isoform X2 n=1 Tax=Halichondria panicea TaxID=6063 RepID=UPI00312B51EA